MDIKVGDRVESGEPSRGIYYGIVIHIADDKAWVRWDALIGNGWRTATNFDTVDDLEDLTKVAE